MGYLQKNVKMITTKENNYVYYIYTFEDQRWYWKKKKTGEAMLLSAILGECRYRYETYENMLKLFDRGEFCIDSIKKTDTDNFIPCRPQNLGLVLFSVTL